MGRPRFVAGCACTLMYAPMAQLEIQPFRPKGARQPMRTPTRRIWERPCSSRLVRRLCFLVALGISGLTAGIASAGTPLRIMPLGDSFTAGNTNAPTWTIPFTFGYRGPLYTRLKEAGFEFQFVGASGEPWNYPFGKDFGRPTKIQGPDLRTVDQDHHRGYGGANTSQILNGGVVGGSTNRFPDIVGMLNADNPDIVLLAIGGNGIADGRANLETLIQKIVDTKPNVRVIVAQIPPRSHYQADLVAYNDHIKNTLVPKFAAQGRHVTTVDQYANFLLPDGKTIDATLFCPDGAHMRPQTNERLAETWFRGIQAVVP